MRIVFEGGYVTARLGAQGLHKPLGTGSPRHRVRGGNGNGTGKHQLKLKLFPDKHVGFARSRLLNQTHTQKETP